MLVSHDWGAIISSAFVANNRQMVHKYILSGAPDRKVFKQALATSEDQRNRSSYIIGFLQRGVAELNLQANDYAFLDPLYNSKDVDVYKHVFSRSGTKIFLFFIFNTGKQWQQIFIS